jgi:sugar phosphate isomerase/epimerase
MDKDSQCDVGEGAMPIVSIFQELKRMNYQGGVMLEYEINADNPLLGMAKSLSYMRGVLDGLAV